MAYYEPGRARDNGAHVMDRAFSVGAALVAGIVAITGVFVVKIARSSASPTAPRTSVNTPGQPGNVGGGAAGDDGSGGLVGGGQFVAPQQNQPPAGRTSGS